MSTRRTRYTDAQGVEHTVHFDHGAQYFTVREDDQWMFDMVGNMLRLRPGVSIPLADGPEREVVITMGKKGA